MSAPAVSLVLSVECPTCGAKVLEGCRTMRLGETHALRRTLATRADEARRAFPNLRPSSAATAPQLELFDLLRGRR